MTITKPPTRDNDRVIDAIDLADGLTAWLIASDDYHQADGSVRAGSPKRPTIRVIVSRLLTDDVDVIDWCERFTPDWQALIDWLVACYGADPEQALRKMTCARSAAVLDNAGRRSHPEPEDVAALSFRRLYVNVVDLLRAGTITDEQASALVLSINGAMSNTERLLGLLHYGTDAEKARRDRWSDLAYPWQETETLTWWN